MIARSIQDNISSSTIRLWSLIDLTESDTSFSVANVINTGLELLIISIDLLGQDHIIVSIESKNELQCNACHTDL